MDTNLAFRSQPIAIELHRLLRDLDPSRFRADIESRARARILDIAEKFRAASERGSASEVDDLHSTLAHVAQVLSSDVPEPALPEDKLAEAWSDYRKRLGEAYESLGQRLRARRVEVPSLRPTNYTRSLVHVGSGVGSLLLIEYVLDDRTRAIVPVAFASFFWFLEISRRLSTSANRFLMWIFKSIAHPREAHHVNSSTWYGTSLALLGLIYPLPLCALAVATVAFADPSASLVGRKWGRTKLVGQRSLEGTSAFAVVATAVGWLSLMIWHGNEFTAGRAFVVACAAGVGSAIAELMSGKLDDNLSVPLAAATIGWAAMHVL